MTDSPLRIVKDDEPEKDEIDPELVKLKRRNPVGPLLAFSVFGFAVYLLLTLRADFFYSLQPENPRDLGRAVDLDRGALPANEFVSVHGVLDQATPAALHGRQGAGYRLVPIMGSHGRFWIHQEGEAGLEPVAYDDRFTGRLRPMRSLPFVDELRGFLRDLPPQPRYLVLAPGTDRLPAADVYGEPLPSLADLDLSVEERATGTSVVLMVATDQIKDQAQAQAALTSAGLADGATVLTSTDTSWTWSVPVEPDAARAKLRAAKLFGAAAAPKTDTFKAKGKDVTTTAETLVVGGHAIPRAALGHIVAFAPPPPLPADDDLWVVLEGETPATYWYMRALCGVLAVVGLLMLWAGVRSVLAGRARPGPRLV